MNFALIVNASPDRGQGAWSAYRFARALLDQGHTLYRVFFYHDGVLNACADRRPAQDENNLTAHWQALEAAHGVDLVVCISAAKRRGLFDEGEARRHGTRASLARGFVLSGLGQYTDALLRADRVVTFGA